MNQYLTPELYAIMPEIVEAATAPLQDNDHYVRLDYRKGYFIHQPRHDGPGNTWR